MKPTINYYEYAANTFRTAAALFLAACLGLAQRTAWAADEGLLDLLREKGLITQQEYEVLLERNKAKSGPANASEQSKSVATPSKDAAPSAEMGGRFADGIVWESADKQHSIAISGRIQADYRKFFGDDALAADTFDIRRAYLGARGKFWSHYEFQVVGDFGRLSGPSTSVCTNATCSATASVPGSTASHLDEAYFNVNWWKQTRFRFGQFDTPFSLETLMSDRFTDFQERSMGSTSLAQGKARGVMIFGTPATGLYYGLAYTNSAGKNTNDTNNTVDEKDVTGRLAGNLAEILGHSRAVYHLGGAFSTGKLPPGSSAPNGRTDGHGITFFVPRVFTGTEVDRRRDGLEVALAYGPVKLQGEYIKATFSGTSAGGEGYDRDIKSYYVNLNWLISGETYASAYSNGLFGRLRPMQNFGPSGAGWGAWEVGLHYTQWNAADFPILAVGAADPGTGVLIPTATAVPANEATGWTVGVKWILNPNTRFLLNHHRTRFATPVTVTSSSPTVTATTEVEKAVTFRGQFDF